MLLVRAMPASQPQATAKKVYPQLVHLRLAMVQEVGRGRIDLARPRLLVLAAARKELLQLVQLQG